MGLRTAGTSQRLHHVFAGLAVTHELATDVATALLRRLDRADSTSGDSAAAGIALPQRQSDEGTNHDLKNDQCADRIRRQEERWNLVISQQTKALD